MNPAVKAVFFDRDGTISRKMEEGDYVKCWSEFEFLPDIFQVLRAIKKSGYLTILVTNQRCIARSIISPSELESIHRNLQSELDHYNCAFDKIFYCPHDIYDNCDCRKPKPGLLLMAEAFYNIDKASSYMVGDTENDIIAGRSYGIKTIKLGGKSFAADYNVDRLINILDIIK